MEFIPLSTFYTTPGFTDERINLFIARDLKPGESSRESDEILELEPMALSAALSMVVSGEIVDGKTMIGLLLAARYLQSA